MHKILVLSTAIFLLASCHRRENQFYKKDGTYHLRFNPPDSSTYHYNTSSETFLTIAENGTIIATHRTSRFSVNYLISKDSNEFILEMTFEGINYQEKNDPDIRKTNAADALQLIRDDLLNRMKGGTFYVRVRPAGQLITTGGVQELVNAAMKSYYAKADIPQASKYWGEWADQEQWKNIHPFVWVTLDSARRPGDHWADTATNSEDINFKINQRFRFDTVIAGMATILSQGQISNDRTGTWLSGNPVTGILSGNEFGRSIIDTATGMPGEMEDSVNVEGNVQIAGHNARLKIIKTLKMTGGKIK